MCHSNQAQAEAVVDVSQPVDEAKEQSKTVPALMDEGAECLAKSKFAEAAEVFAYAVEKL